MVRKSNDSSGRERMRRRADERRLEILRAAARTFRRVGFASAGMRDIAREADLSPANLYHYFAGKHELLFFCQDRALDRMLEALERARLSGAPDADRVRDVLAEHVRCILEELDAASAHLEIAGLPDELRARLVRKRDRYERGLRRLVQDGVRSGAFVAVDAALVTRAMLGATNWTAQWFRPNGGKSPHTVATATAEYLVAGLTRAATSAPEDSTDERIEEGR